MANGTVWGADGEFAAIEAVSGPVSVLGRLIYNLHTEPPRVVSTNKTTQAHQGSTADATHLIEGREDVVSELHLADRRAASSGVANAERGDALVRTATVNRCDATPPPPPTHAPPYLLTQRRVEHSLGTELLHQAHGAPKHAAEGNVFTEQHLVLYVAVSTKHPCASTAVVTHRRLISRQSGTHAVVQGREQVHFLGLHARRVELAIQAGVGSTGSVEGAVGGPCTPSNGRLVRQHATQRITPQGEAEQANRRPRQPCRCRPWAPHPCAHSASCRWPRKRTVAERATELRSGAACFMVSATTGPVTEASQQGAGKHKHCAAGTIARAWWLSREMMQSSRKKYVM